MYTINAAAAAAKLAKANPQGQPAKILKLWLENPTISDRASLRKLIDAEGGFQTVQSTERVLAFYLTQWVSQGVITKTTAPTTQRELPADWRQLQPEPHVVLIEALMEAAAAA